MGLCGFVDDGTWLSGRLGVGRDKRPSVVECAERAREDRGGAARTAGGCVERAIEATVAQKLVGRLCRAFLGKTGPPASSIAGRA